MEEEGVVPPPPIVVEEEEVVVPPPPIVVVEEEGVVLQPLPLVDDVISLCEEALLKLQEIVAVLVQEPGDAADILYANLLEVAPPGLDSLLLLDPAAKLVDGLFNWFVNVAAVLVSTTFNLPGPDGGPLQSARRDLGYLVHVVHDEAGRLFRFYLIALDELGLVPSGQGAFEVWVWVANHNQSDAQGRLALQRLEVALDRSLSAVLAIRLCWGPSRVPTAVLRLQETISEVVEVLVVLRRMRDSLVQLEQAVLNITGNGQDAPPP